MRSADDRPACALFATPLGECGLAWTSSGDEAGIARVLLPDARIGETRRRLCGVGRLVPRLDRVADAVALDAIARIGALLGGEATDLAPIRLDWRGVGDFERRVYEATRAIAPGRTVTYGALARTIGDVTAVRAVGRALGRNPYPIVVPCHRVVAAGGRIGGFSAPGGAANQAAPAGSRTGRRVGGAAARRSGAGRVTRPCPHTTWKRSARSRRRSRSLALGELAWEADMSRACMRRSLFGVLVCLSAVPVSGAGEVVVPWRAPGVSSPRWESHPAFDPRSGDLYFVRSSPAFSGWRILRSACGKSGWSPPEEPGFVAPGLEADPFFADGGKTLYFISTRQTGSASSKDLDLWLVRRDEHDVWGRPERLPEPVNSAFAEWFPRPSVDGWLYFGSSRPGGLGGNDIWRARAKAPGGWEIENLGPAVNTAKDEFEALPSPDGTRLIVMTDGGLFETRRGAGPTAAWTPRVRLPAAVNENGSEVGALFSPSGRSLLFSRDTRAPDSGEFFVWHEQGWEDWPPACPRP